MKNLDDIKIVAGKVGARTKIYINGDQIGNCTRVEFVAQAGGMNKVVFEVIPTNVLIELPKGHSVLRMKEKKLKTP